MDRSEQISNWYKQLQRVSRDDKADFEVMLLDKRNPEDAVAAVTGMMMNLIDSGFKEDVLLLLIDGTREENASLVRHHSIVEVLQMCLLFDAQIRRSRDVQEALLEMIAQHQELALQVLHKMYILNTRLLKQLSPVDVKQTLIYRLVVVGERAQKMFGDLP